MNRFEKIAKIAKHFENQIPGKRIDLMMDIEYVDKVHNLALDSMLEDLDSFDVAHDVIGIYRHLDRKTKKLTGHWTPRFGRDWDYPQRDLPRWGKNSKLKKEKGNDT